MEKTVFLVRHGETRLNAMKRFSGHRGAALSKKGLRQAKRIGCWFAARKIRFDAVFSSPLLRSERTARIIAEQGCFEDGSIRIDSRLKELDFGFWEGKTGQTVEKTFPGVVSKWFLDRWSVTPFRGESYSHLEKRVGVFVRRLARLRAATILVVCHANVLHVLIKLLAGLNRKQANRLPVHNNLFFSVSFRKKKRVLKRFSV